MVMEGRIDSVREPTWSLAFLGSVVPEAWRDTYPLVKSPTIEIQQNIAREWASGSMPLDRIFTTLPVPRFPRAELSSLRHPETLVHGVRTIFLGWMNWEPCKSVSIGLDLVRKVRQWARGVRADGKKPVLFAYNLGPSHWQAPACLLAAKLSGAPLISLVTDLEPPAKEDGLLRPLLSVALKIQLGCLGRASGLAVLNEQVLHDLPRAVAHSVVVNGLVPDDGFTRELLRLSDVTAGDLESPVLMYLGSLNQARGADLLLEAFLEWDHPSARLEFVGDGPLRDSLEKRAAGNERITFRGFVSDPAQLLRYYEAADILVNPHRIDVPKARYVFPSKLAQCLASGRPVVSTDQGGARKAFEGMAWFAEEDTPDGLANVFDDLLAAEFAEIRSRSDKGRDYVSSEKLWERQAPELARFVERAAGVAEIQ